VRFDRGHTGKVGIYSNNNGAARGKRHLLGGRYSNPASAKER